MRLPKWVRIGWNWLRAAFAAKPILSTLIPTGMFSAYVGYLASTVAAAPHIVALAAGLAIPIGFTAASSAQDFLRKNTVRGHLNITDVLLAKGGDAKWHVGVRIKNTFGHPLYMNFERDSFHIGDTVDASPYPDSDIRIVPPGPHKEIFSGPINRTILDGDKVTADLEIVFGKNRDELFEKLTVKLEAIPPNYDGINDINQGSLVGCLWVASKYEFKAV